MYIPGYIKDLNRNTPHYITSEQTGNRTKATGKQHLYNITDANRTNHAFLPLSDLLPRSWGERGDVDMIMCKQAVWPNASLPAYIKRINTCHPHTP